MLLRQLLEAHACREHRQGNTNSSAASCIADARHAHPQLPPAQHLQPERLQRLRAPHLQSLAKGAGRAWAQACQVSRNPSLCCTQSQCHETPAPIPAAPEWLRSARHHERVDFGICMGCLIRKLHPDTGRGWEHAAAKSVRRCQHNLLLDTCPPSCPAADCCVGGLLQEQHFCVITSKG